jgi:hypothetical protein
MAQVVENQLSKHKAQTSNISIEKKEKSLCPQNHMIQQFGGLSLIMPSRVKWDTEWSTWVPISPCTSW